MVQLADTPSPQTATLGLHPVAVAILLISRPAKGRWLRWPEHTVGYSNLLKVACSGPGVSRTRNLSVTSPILYHYTSLQ